MKKLIWAVLAILLLTACRQDLHFLTDKDYRAEVHADFATRMAEFSMLEVQLDTLCTAEREAMEFLYAYMPLCDLANYHPDFFLRQVRYAFLAREEMSWGKDVPEDIFRHFVLVYRVNNENLDTARMVFYRELKERVKDMSMEEAALEVNHWCHEHVAYRASDSRTSAPLATMRTSLGRCGEESTFTVTALRSVGIPARQCYTPRWAHCDDNHAWVEVYVDGEWKFLGACEPEPRLNMGWFSVPSTRCMMVHTKAFGKYKGDEEVVRRTNLFSELNLLSHYAPTRHVTVTVTDKDGKPLQGAQVKFKLYNYSEYYTLATMTTDKEGHAGLTTGLGDLMIWATDGESYDFRKMDVRKDSVKALKLEKNVIRIQYREDWVGCFAPEDWIFEMVPPAAGEPKVTATEEETAANAKRLAYEDSLRNAYIATFPTKENYKQVLKPTKNLTDEQAWEIIHKSEGNYKEIIKFINAWPGGRSLEHLYDYLKSYSDKDLRDIAADVLQSHVTNFDWHNHQLGIGSIISGKTLEYDVYKKGLLPARISNEMVRPYREELGKVFFGMTQEQIRQWVTDSITIDDSSNYYNCPISPVGVYKLRRADGHSRDIFFVAACCAACVPAYLDNATNTIYVCTGDAEKLWKKGKWEAISFEEKTAVQPTAKLTLTYKPTKELKKPVYWSHFTLAKLENGDLRTFDFEDDPRMAQFPATIKLEPGTYCLSTGNRYPDGAVRSRMEFFEVKEGEKLSKEIVILPLLTRTDEVNAVNPYIELFYGVELQNYAGNKGMLYINLGNYGEPSKHLVVELKGLQKEMQQWGGKTLMVGPASIDMPSWNLVHTDYAYQKNQLEHCIVEAVKIDNMEYPLVAFIDKEGHILYHSTGYKIGVIEQVLKVAGKR